MWRAIVKRLAAIVHKLTPCSWLGEVAHVPPIEYIRIAAQGALAAYADEIPEGAFAYDIPSVDGRVLVRRIGKRLRISIRGTANARNVITDLSARRVLDSTTGHRFHEGFLTYANAVWQIVQEVIEPDDVVGFDGHSLGGSVAAILSVKLLATRPEIAQSPTVTFGAPMVGDKHAAEAVAKASNLLRVVNDNDIVPLLPISPKYWHEGTVLVIDSAGDSKPFAAQYAFRAGFGSWFGSVAKGHRRIGTEYSDHRMTEYVAALAERDV